MDLRLPIPVQIQHRRAVRTADHTDRAGKRRSAFQPRRIGRCTVAQSVGCLWQPERSYTSASAYTPGVSGHRTPASPAVRCRWSPHPETRLSVYGGHRSRVRKLKAFTRRNGKMRPGEKLFIRTQRQRHASELWAVLCRPCEAPAHEHPAAGIVQLIMLQRCVLFLRAFTLKNRIPRKTAAPQALQAFPVHTKGRAVARTERIFRHAQLSVRLSARSRRFPATTSTFPRRRVLPPAPRGSKCPARSLFRRDRRTGCRPFCRPNLSSDPRAAPDRLFPSAPRSCRQSKRAKSWLCHVLSSPSVHLLSVFSIAYAHFSVNRPVSHIPSRKTYACFPTHFMVSSKK